MTVVASVGDMVSSCSITGSVPQELLLSEDRLGLLLRSELRLRVLWLLRLAVLLLGVLLLAELLLLLRVGLGKILRHLLLHLKHLYLVQVVLACGHLRTSQRLHLRHLSMVGLARGVLEAPEGLSL